MNKIIQVKGVRYRISFTIKDTGSNYNLFVSVFKVGCKSALCGTSFKKSEPIGNISKYAKLALRTVVNYCQHETSL